MSTKNYFAFDEALEQFGVMFIKQNIGGKPMTADELRIQIAAVQSERDHLTMLFSEYIGDTIHINKERRLKLHKDALQKLIGDLISCYLTPRM